MDDLTDFEAENETDYLSTAAVPHPVFILKYEQKNITNAITPYVVAVTYTNHLSGKSDELEVELEDSDGRWLDSWYPGKGDTLTLELGYEEQPLLPAGKFVIDEIEYQCPPSTVRIKGLAAAVNKSLRTRKSTPFENTTLAAITQRIAKRNKLTLVGKIRPIQISRITQYHEHDVEFLSRLASEYGYICKVTNDKLVFSERDDLHDDTSAVQLADADLINVMMRDKIKGVYGSVKGKYQDASKKKLVTYELKADGTVGKAASGDTLKFTSRASSKAEMQGKAAAKLNAANQKQMEGRMLVKGNPRLVAGNRVTLKNMGKMSGQFLINSARHSIDRDKGYTTEIEVNKGKTSGKKKTKLKVYGVKKDGTVGTVAYTTNKGTAKK